MHWIDNGDTYICPKCGFETGNPHYYIGSKCPVCGFQDPKDAPKPAQKIFDLGFTVIDTKTGQYPDLEKIALTEQWAKHLMYCDMDGFAISEDGNLILMDDCGGQAYAPEGRFIVVLEDLDCPICSADHEIIVYAKTDAPKEEGEYKRREAKYCPECGKKVNRHE